MQSESVPGLRRAGAGAGAQGGRQRPPCPTGLGAALSLLLRAVLELGPFPQEWEQVSEMF